MEAHHNLLAELVKLNTKIEQLSTTIDAHHYIGFLRLQSVLQLLPVSQTKWYQCVQQKRYPQPIKLGRITMWKKCEIFELIKKIENGEHI